MILDRVGTSVFLFFTFGFLGCVQPASQSTKESDWAAIVSIEAQAKAIANTSGCSTVSQCRTAPVGNQACGGPRYYIAYCANTTDSVALFRKLDEVARAETEYNRKYELVSTCVLRTPPALRLESGSCAATGAAAVSPVQ